MSTNGHLPAVCARCGLSFDVKREAAATVREGAGRMASPVGPMHFGCYWLWQRETLKRALR